MHLQELKKLETRLLEPISIPVIGRCLQKKAVTALAEDNSPDAVKVLAKAVTRLKDEEIKDIVLDALGKLRNQRCIDAFCQVWADTRHRDLTNLLVKKNWVASAPVDVRVLSALKAKQLQVITNSGKEIVEPLFNAFQDKDTEIANRASECAISFTNPKAIDYICHKWAETRDKLLEELVCKGKYIARQPIELKVLTVLKVAKLEIIELEILELEIIQDCGKEIVDSLLNALKDKDAEIASRANECLPFFSNYDSIDYICQKWSKTRGKTLEQICQETQYAPREPSQRALFYFLTGQWDKYESLDYEHSLLQKVYELGDEKLRKRIADKARQAGRVELVKIITGVRQQSKKISDAEWEIIIGILITSKKYDDMWQLAQTAPARWSMLLLNKLRELQWTPQEIAIREQFVQLVSLASNCTSDVPVSGMLKSCHKILTGHTRQIVSLLINLDGDILVSGTNLCGTTRSIIRLWSLPSGKLMKTLDGHTDSASHLAITPNGKILVSASDRVSLNDDGTKNVFDANGYWGYTKEIWSPTEEEQKTIKLWSLPDGKLLKSLNGHIGGVTHLAISPDGKILISVGGLKNKTIQLWSLPDGQFLKTLSEPTHDVGNIAISPDGKILISTGYIGDNTVRLWSLPNGQCLKTLSLSDDASDMAMSPKGRFFVTRDSFFHNIQLWSLPDGKLLNTFSIDGGYKRDGNMCLSPDGRILIIACQHNIQLWSVPECKLLKTLDKSWDFQGLSVSPDGKILVAGRNNSVSLWSLPDGQLIDEIYGGGSHNRRIAISPDSSFLVIPKYWDSGYSDYPINLWSLGTRHYINIPVNNTTLQDLELVQTSLQDSKLTNSEQNWLQFLLALMRWHKRFEIEVANAPQKIDAGEFEIEIEG